MSLTFDIAEHAGGLARECGVDSVCVLLSNKSTPRTQLFCIANFNVAGEVLNRYEEHRICDCDPYTDIEACETLGRISGSPFIAREKVQAGRRAPGDDAYWRFVTAHDIDVVGASTLRLLPRLYLTIGAHRVKSRRRRKAVAIERLSAGVDALQGRIASSLLSAVLTQAAGYASLVRALEPAPAREDAAEMSRLSRRETEVARLVCEGKQNKEIAFLARLSEHTVENHLRRIYRKFGIHNRAALVARVGGALHS